MKMIQSPEFWSALAFGIVVFAVIKPGCRFLKKWGQKQADAILRQQKEAEDVLQKAKKLCAQYKTVYQNRGSERQKIMREAEKEIQFLEKEAVHQTEDRMTRKKQEVDLRLKMIAENGEQDIKRKMLSQLVKQTEIQLRSGQAEDTDELVKEACAALDRYEPALRQ